MNKPYVFSFVMFMSRHLDRQQSISGLIVVPSRILGTGKLGPEVQSCPMSVFINKVLLEHRHSCLFTYCLWLHSQYHSRVELQ